MSEFGPKSAETQPGVETNAQTRLAGPMILEAKRTYEAFASRCADSGLLERDRWGNLEEVFAVAEALEFAGVPAVDLSGDRVPIADLLARIRIWIWKTYQQLPVMTDEKRAEALPNREPYERLFSLLAKSGLANQTTIITTNYDIVVEYFAYLQGTRVHYPFDWDPAFGVTASEEQFVTGAGPVEGPLLCKLHGSINYFEGVEGELGVAADVGDGGEAVGNTGARRFAGEPTIAMYDAIWKIGQDHPGSLPAIVPPSYAKLRQTDWLVQTWNQARMALTNAETVVFIGYSMPRSDGFMRALFIGSQMLRPDGSRPRVLVVDKSEGVRGEYESLFGAIEPANEMTFAEAAIKLLPDVVSQVVDA